MITEELIAARLREVVQPKFSPSEFRLSEVGKCRRLRVLRALGNEPEPWTEEDARYFERGHIAEAWVVEQYRRAYPRHTRTQTKVRTPYGTGHIDLWFPARQLVIEVKSVGRWSFDHAIPRTEHLAQVQAYLHFFRDSQGRRKAKAGELVYVCMDSLQTREFEVQYDPAQGEAIERDLAELSQMVRNAEMPPVEYFPDQEPCVTYTPQGARRCPFWRYCHQDTDDLDPLYTGQADKEAEALIAEYRTVKAKIQQLEDAHRQALDPLKAKVVELQEALAQVYDRLGVDQVVTRNGVVVKRTRVPGRLTWDLTAAEKAGVFTAEMKQALTPFAKHGDEYVRWTIREAKGGSK